jgi:hypothetical protein
MRSLSELGRNYYKTFLKKHIAKDPSSFIKRTSFEEAHSQRTHTPKGSQNYIHALLLQIPTTWNDLDPRNEV